MFPLSEKNVIGYAFGETTFYNSFHIGTDYEAYYVDLFAPFDGFVTTSIGNRGGKTIVFKPDHDDVLIRFLHLDKFIKVGRVKSGDLIATTGNTGVSTNPHVHIDISKHKLDLNNPNNFINPETYNWNMYKQTILVIENRVNHEVIQAILNQAAGYFYKVTNGDFKIEFKTLITDQSFNVIKQQGLTGANYTTIDIDVVDPKQIRTISKGYNPTVLFFDSKELPVAPNHPVNHGDITQIAITPNITHPSQTEVLTETFVHELLHNWFWKLKEKDTVHNHSGIYDPLPQANFSDIILKLKPRWAELSDKTMNNQARIVKSKNSPTVYVVYPMPNMDYLKTKANLEGFEVPVSIPDTDSL